MTSGDEYVRHAVGSRTAELRRSAVRRTGAGRQVRLRRAYMMLWWAARPRRRLACLVTTPDGIAVLGGRAESIR